MEERSILVCRLADLELIRKELNQKRIKSWEYSRNVCTNSQVLLVYIRSTTRFKIFMANWVQKIQEGSDVNQWNYVKGKGNPADDAIRGLDPRKETLSSRWLTGPAFFWQTEEFWPSYCEVT